MSRSRSITAGLQLNSHFGNAPRIHPQELNRRINAVFNADGGSFQALAKLAKLNPKKSFQHMNLDDLDFSAGSGNVVEGFNFRGASLRNTKWENGSMKGMLLEAADLRGAKGLTDQMLAEAYINEQTLLPKGLTREIIKVLHEALELPPPPRLLKNFGVNSHEPEPAH